RRRPWRFRCPIGVPDDHRDRADHRAVSIRRKEGAVLMVEHRPLRDILAYAVLTLAVLIIVFPVYLAFVASTHHAGSVLSANMPLLPGDHLMENYQRVVLTGTAQSREPVGRMLANSFISAIGIAVGKILISILSAYAVVYFRFPFRKTAFWVIFMTLM